MAQSCFKPGRLSCTSRLSKVSKKHFKCLTFKLPLWVTKTKELHTRIECSPLCSPYLQDPPPKESVLETCGPFLSRGFFTDTQAEHMGAGRQICRHSTIPSSGIHSPEATASGLPLLHTVCSLSGPLSGTERQQRSILSKQTENAFATAPKSASVPASCTSSNFCLHWQIKISQTDFLTPLQEGPVPAQQADHLLQQLSSLWAVS